ncbi:MAG: hypothetical protein ACI4M2_05790 [Christensenellales bacterium]
MKKRTTLVFLILSIILLLFSLAACTKKEQKQKAFVIREDLTREEILQTLKDCDSFTIGGEVIVKEFVEKGYDFYDTVATYVTNSGVTIHNKSHTGEGAWESVETYLADGDKGHEFYWRNRDGKIEDSYELIDVNTIKPKERVLDPELSWEAKQIESWPYTIKDNQIVFEEEKGGYIYKIVIKDINNTKLIIPDRYKNYKSFNLEKCTYDDLLNVLSTATSFTTERQGVYGKEVRKYTEKAYSVSYERSETSVYIREGDIVYKFDWTTGHESTARYTADDYDHSFSTSASNREQIKILKEMGWNYEKPPVKARYENGILCFDVLDSKTNEKLMTYKDINNTQLEIPEKYKDYKNLPLTSKFRKNSSLDDVRKIMSKSERFYVGYKYYDSNGREITTWDILDFLSLELYYQKGYRKDRRKIERHYFENGIEYIATVRGDDKQIEKREATETYNYVDKVNEIVDRIEGNEYTIQDDVIRYKKQVVINSKTYIVETRISCSDRYVPEEKQYNGFDVVSSLNGVFENTLERPSSDVKSAGDSLQGKTKEQIIELLKSANNYTALIEKEYGGVTSTANLFLSKEKGMSQLKLNFDNGPVLAYYAEFVEDRLYMLEKQSTLFGGDTYSRAYANEENVTNESIFGKYTLDVIKYIESEDVEMTIYGNMVMFEKNGLKVLVKDVDNTTPIIVSECRGYENLRTSDASEKVLSVLPTEQVLVPSWNLKSDGDSMEGMTLEQIKQYVLSSSSCTFLWYMNNDGNEECENYYVTKDGVSGVHWENRKNVEKMGFFAELFKNGKQFSLEMEMVAGKPIATANSVVLNDESFPYESALSDILSGVDDMTMTIRGNKVMFEKDGVKLMIKDINHTVLQLPEQFLDYENLPLTK